MLEIGRLASRKAPVIDEAAASERLSQYLLLLSGWIEPVLVGPLRLFAHGLCAFLLLFYMLLNRVNYLAISRSLVLFGDFLESLQKSRVNVERKSLCLHTGSISLFYLYIKKLQAQVPTPQLRNAPSIPGAEAQGFTARFDNYSENNLFCYSSLYSY
jgi:hypothetical protein